MYKKDRHGNCTDHLDRNFAAGINGAIMIKIHLRSKKGCHYSAILKRNPDLVDKFPSFDEWINIINEYLQAPEKLKDHEFSLVSNQAGILLQLEETAA